MTDTLHQQKIQEYSFSLAVEKVQLRTSLARNIRISFKLGPKQSFMKAPIRLEDCQSVDVPNELLELTSEVIYNQSNRSYQPLKAIAKMYLITDKGERLGGVVYLNLDEYLNSYSSLGKSTEVSISNSPDPNAKLTFRLQVIGSTEDAKNNDKDNHEELVQECKSELASSLDMSARLIDDIPNGTQVFDIRSYLNSLQEIDTLKAQKQQKQSELQRLSAVIKNISKEETQLKRALLELKEQNKQLKFQLELKEQQKVPVQAGRQDFESTKTYCDIQNEMERIRKQCDQQLSVLKEENKSLKNTIGDYKKLEEELKGKIVNLTKELTGLDKSKSDNLIAKIKQLESNNKLYKEQAATQKAKMIADYKQKQNEYIQKIKSVEQKMLNSGSVSHGKPARTNEQSYQCPKCKSLEQDCSVKFQNYEQQLQVLEGIVNERQQETRKYQRKLEDRVRKCKFYEAQANKIKEYKQMLSYALSSLISLNNALGDDDIYVKKVADNTQPYGFKIAFEQLINEARTNMSLRPEIGRQVSHQSEIQGNRERIQLLEEIKSKQALLVKQTNGLATAHSRIEELEQQMELQRSSLQNLRTQYNKMVEQGPKKLPDNERISFGHPGNSNTPKFNEISFSKLPATPSSELHDHESIAHMKTLINKLIEEKGILDNEIKLWKTGSVIIERRPSKGTNSAMVQSAIKMLDDNFTLDGDKEAEGYRKALQMKKMYTQLLTNYEQLNNDYEVLKKQNDMYRQLNNKLRLEIEGLRRYMPYKKNTLPTIEEENSTIEQELKELIESLDAPDKHSTYPGNFSESSVAKQPNSMIPYPVLTQIKGQLEKKLSALDLQLLMLHSAKFSKCNNNQQTQDTIGDFNRFRQRLSEMARYVNSIGR